MVCSDVNKSPTGYCSLRDTVRCHACDGVAEIWSYCETLTVAGVYYSRTRRRNTPTTPCSGGNSEGIGINYKSRTDCMISDNVGEGVATYRSLGDTIHRHI